MSGSPRVSIGIPVYNGAATIGATIESLQAQTFGDFELIVCDNASTDGLADRVTDMARLDQRIRHVRHPVNLGANRNYSHAAKVARGEFLKWSSASDWCAPTFLERCVEALDRDPGAVLAVPRTRLFQGDPAQSEDYPYDIEILEERPLDRLLALDARMRLNNAINGVIRLSALHRTRLIEPYHCADLVLMGHLAVLGRFRLIDAPLFYRRMEVGTATALQDAEGMRRHHYPVLTARTLFQGWKRHLGWLRVAALAPMPMAERGGALKHVVQNCFWDRATLLADLRGAWRYATRSRVQSPGSP